MENDENGAKAWFTKGTVLVPRSPGSRHAVPARVPEDARKENGSGKTGPGVLMDSHRG